MASFKPAQRHSERDRTIQNTSSTLTAFMAQLLFLSRVLVKFYCDIITRNRLQPINTSIDTFFSKLRAFLVEQRRRRQAVEQMKFGGGMTFLKLAVDQNIQFSILSIKGTDAFLVFFSRQTLLQGSFMECEIL